MSAGCDEVNDDRRLVLRAIALSPAAASLGAFACGTTDGARAPGVDAGATTDAGTSVDAGTTTDAGTTGWATGGTKAMTMSALYPDPFAMPVAGCALATASTLGPCTEDADRVRRDISEGYGGLPMRLALRIVDAACMPVAGVKVKIWHTEIRGGYSGDTPSAQCLREAADKAKHFFRGVQTTDADGRVGFDSCFPGWYPGRAIHIHYTISLGTRAFTSQLFFEQALVDEIFTSHPEYVPFGRPNTSNAQDGIVPGSGLAALTLTTARMPDGALLASKQLVLPG